jgi:uncharacterized membrane protein YsdA (DUF1294 family)
MPFMHYLTPANVITAIIAMNVLAFAAFGIDKGKASRGGWRTSEDTLLLLALLGGIFGAYAGRRVFRHKTRKQPFGNQLFTIAVFQAVAGGLAIGWWYTG